MIEINYNGVLNTDVSFLLKYYDNIGHIQTAQNNTLPSLQHYKLLTYLSYKFDNTLIIDAGTHQGISALCLAQNKNNKVITYDIENKNLNGLLWENQHTSFGLDYPNLSFKNKDILSESEEIFLASKFIFFDTVHDGVHEILFANLIEKIKYGGYILCDDIFSPSHNNMLNWWNSLKWVKHDLTEIGHITGSGLLDCANNGIKIIKNI
jgi:hypothetical protein